MPEQFSPTRLLVTLLVLIFCIEGAMMFALDHLLPKGTPVWVGATIDAGLLTAITSIFVCGFSCGRSDSPCSAKPPKPKQ